MAVLSLSTPLHIGEGYGGRASLGMGAGGGSFSSGRSEGVVLLLKQIPETCAADDVLRLSSVLICDANLVLPFSVKRRSSSSFRRSAMPASQAA